MGKWHYYNEFDPFAVEWLRNLIKKGLIPDGEVDTRSIVDVRPDDVRGFVQCHYFAGIAGWPLALRFAGWPEGRPVWTGSCPCQPFSVAGKGKGTDDERHLWPAFFNLIRECRPAIVFGEQVASKAGREWLSGVFADLERVGYAGAGADLCAPGVGAPHIRQRLYWVATGLADADTVSVEERQVCGDGISVRTRADAASGDYVRGEAVVHGQPLARRLGEIRVSNDMADAESIGRRGRAHNEDEGRREQPSADTRTGSGNVVDAESLGRREGWTEHELRGRGPATAGAGGGDVADTNISSGKEWGIELRGKSTPGELGITGQNDMADADGGQFRAGRGDDGEVRGLPEAQRQSEYCASLSVRSGEANGSGDMADAEEPRLEGRRHGPAVEGSAPGNRDTRTMRGDTGNMADAEGQREPSGPDECSINSGGRFIVDGTEPWSDGLNDGKSVFGDVGDADDARRKGRFITGDMELCRTEAPLRPAWSAGSSNAWADSEWRRGADGKERRTKSGVRLLVAGISGGVALERTLPGGEKETHIYSRVGALRGFGNAIVPQLAAEFIKVFMSYGE